MRQTVSRWPLAAALLLPLFGLAACSSGSNAPAATAAPPPPPPSLYSRLGGQPAIVAVVDDFVANVAADKRVNRRFRHTNIPHLKQELVDQICAGTGGPCQYTGKSMKEAHKGMGISDAEFNAVVQDLRKSMAKHNVAEQDQSDLLAILGPMRDDIVSPPAARPAMKKAPEAKAPVKKAVAKVAPVKAPAKKPVAKKPAAKKPAAPPAATTPPAPAPAAPAPAPAAPAPAAPAPAAAPPAPAPAPAPAAPAPAKTQ